MNRNPAITPPSAVPPAAPGAARFVPGYVLGGRYRMIALLGRSGRMGEVWRADDLLLETPVALKLIFSADPDARHHVLHEVRLARQLTHPAICRVFDVGEGEGEIFYSMELVRGEDLATLIRRLGRLPAEKVVEIGQHLCEGLGAAHAQGILHRDLKPANVLIDPDGFVRITDFGIAGARDGAAHEADGTPAYLAPEQVSSGIPLSERTDIYAVGLILYELLVGRHPFDGGSDARRPPARPSRLIDHVSPHLEKAILGSIAPDPRNRPASVLELSRLLTPPVERRRSARFWALTTAAMATVALIGAGATFVMRPTGPALTGQDTIMLADFVNTTGEPVFDGALKVALAVSLEQSPFLKVFPDDRVRDTLRFMQRPANVRVTRQMAREIARREQLKAFVSGSIARLGRNYIIALEAVSAETGEVVAREQIEVTVKEQVLASLGSATSRLREKLGESLAVIERFDVPLAQATTPSLEALHAYSLALDEGRLVPGLEALPHLRRAIELDPGFAMAQALLSGVFSNSDRHSEASVFSRKAFELRDRVSERERFFISWRYYIDAEQAWDKALDLGLSWTRTYPREAFAFNSLGLASATFGRHDQAADAFREAIRLDPRFLPPHGNLAGSLIALNRFDEARSVVARADGRGVGRTTIRRTSYLLAFLAGDASGMKRELDLVRGTADAMFASNWEARTSAFAGRSQTAHSLHQRGVEDAVARRLHDLAAQWTVEDAEMHAIGGDCKQAQREIAAGLELSRDNFTLQRAGRVLAFCNDDAGALRVAGELKSRFPNATLTMRMHVPVMSAALALRRHDFAGAIGILEPVKPYESAPASEFWPSYLRGEAYLGMKNGPAAADQFQSIIDRRGTVPTSPLHVLAHLGAARAAALAGQNDKVRTACRTFLSMWDHADAPLRRIGETTCGRALAVAQ